MVNRGLLDAHLQGDTATLEAYADWAEPNLAHQRRAWATGSQIEARSHGLLVLRQLQRMRAFVAYFNTMGI